MAERDDNDATARQPSSARRAPGQAPAADFRIPAPLVREAPGRMLPIPGSSPQRYLDAAQPAEFYFASIDQTGCTPMREAPST